MTTARETVAERLSQASMEWLDEKISAALKCTKRYAKGSQNHQRWMIRYLDLVAAKHMKQERIFEKLGVNKPTTI